MLKFSFNITLTFLLLCGIGPQGILLGQEKIEIGEKFHITSEILGMEREIYLGLPKGYNDTLYAPQDYPVLYFFDGDTQFETFVSQRNWLSRNLYADLPGIILVGIPHKDRSRELTPTAMATPEDWKRADFSTSGGNPEFMRFISEELKPYIDKNFRTNGFEILSGHSLGGLAVVNALLRNPDSFDAYISVDPSLWWDNEELIGNLGDDWYRSGHDGKIMFLAKADDPGSGQAHHKAILDFHETLQDLPKGTRLEWRYAFYPGEGHGSVLVPAVFDALRFVFQGYQMPVKQAMKDPSVLQGHFDALSERLGYLVRPEERLIDDMARVCVRQALFQQAAELLALNRKNYPQSPHAKKRHMEFLREHAAQLGQD